MLKARKNMAGAAPERRFTPRNNRTMFLGSGITLPKTSSNSYRFFALAASRVRVRWMCPGAVLDIAPGITVLLGGGR